MKERLTELSEEAKQYEAAACARGEGEAAAAWALLGAACRLVIRVWFC